MTSNTIETNPPTYRWATALGAVASIIGLVILAVCITVSVVNRTAHGFAPVPQGVLSLGSVLTISGLVLLVFRILHADREGLMDCLEKLDQKVDNVWGIAAVTSIEAKPARTEQHYAPRQRNRRRRGHQGGDQRDSESARSSEVSRLPSADVLREARGLARRVISNERRRVEDNPEDRKPM